MGTHVLMTSVIGVYTIASDDGEKNQQESHVLGVCLNWFTSTIPQNRHSLQVTMSAPLKACQVLCQSRRLVATLPCIQTAIKQMKAFSSFGSARLPEDPYLEDPANPNTDLNVVWPDTSLGPLANKDRRFPMPGSVGVGSLLQPDDQPVDELDTVDPARVLQTRAEERKAVIEQFNFVAEMEAFSAPAQPAPGPHRWECSAQECPEILVKDFQELFPGRQLGSDQLTVITISHHTHNDMSTWSPDVEAEREGVLQTFIQGGEELCTVLKDMGYWADFVDPSSGRPYYGEYTNATLFETDERYRKLGFEIRDLGCCKVVAHHLWGTHTFLGSVFTNCPVDDPVLCVLLRNTN